jgi:hypothetical protein
MIQRFWRFSRVALLLALMTGCATVNDMRAQKASGLAQSYLVPPDRAWQIAHAVLDATSAVAIGNTSPIATWSPTRQRFCWACLRGLPSGSTPKDRAAASPSAVAWSGPARSFAHCPRRSSTKPSRDG